MRQQAAQPFAQAGEPVSILDALFTATSAVCVTGLTVVDTGTGFSPAGQAVVLALIQVGGLGLMTFSVFVGVVLGRKVAFTDRMVIQDSMNHTPKAGVRRLVRYVVGFTLATEAGGALLLWLGKKKPTPPGELIKLLAAYHFPSNVRELESMVYNAVSLHSSGKLSMDTFKTRYLKKSRV